VVVVVVIEAVREWQSEMMIWRQRDMELAGAEAPAAEAPAAEIEPRKAVRGWWLQMNNEDPGDSPGFSEMMIRRQRDMEPAGAEAAAAEAPAAEIEAREDMTDAEIAAARRNQGGRHARRRRNN
jgi:hypothetical protein